MTPRRTRGLRYDDAEHRYWLDRLPVPNVSNIVVDSDVSRSFDGVPPDVLDAALLRGKHVHLAMRYFLEGDLDDRSLDPRIAPYLAGGRSCLTALRFRPIALECPLASRRYGFAGTPDAIGFLPDPRRTVQRALGDWKSGLLDRVGAELQTAAYDILWSENFPREPLHARFVLRLQANGFFKLVELGHPDARTMFLYALELHHNPSGGSAPAYRAALASWSAGLR